VNNVHPGYEGDRGQIKRSAKSALIISNFSIIRGYYATANRWWPKPFLFLQPGAPLGERRRDAGVMMHFDVDKVLAPSRRRKIGYI
jgi:hypothetical protein